MIHLAVKRLVGHSEAPSAKWAPAWALRSASIKCLLSSSSHAAMMLSVMLQTSTNIYKPRKKATSSNSNTAPKISCTNFNQAACSFNILSGDLRSKDAKDLHQQCAVNLWGKEVAIAQLAPPHLGQLVDHTQNLGKPSGKKYTDALLEQLLDEALLLRFKKLCTK